MVIILVGVSVFVAGIFLGKEWAIERRDQQLLELQKDLEFWREIATRKIVPEPPPINGGEL